MEWYNIIVLIFGAIGGTGGIVSLFTAKAKRDGMLTESMQKIVDEAQEERASLRQIHNEYVEESDKRMKYLENKVNQLEKRDTIKMRAINSAYRCKLPAAIADCPVLKTLKDGCDRNEGVCKVN
ncbi:MAG: hypothetical protein NC048_10065 [Bacteroides sp.]|nr:hypothetical protein [Bacteroides sp.]